MIRPPIQVFGIEGRYAMALYSAASKQKCLDTVEKDLINFQNAMKDVKLREIVINPTMKRSVKATALRESADKANFAPATGFFLEQLAENGRLNKMDSVINAFKLIMSAHRGEVVCEVITAKPLEAGQRKELEAQLKVRNFAEQLWTKLNFNLFQKFVKSNETIHLTAKVDKAIIGGMVVSIGDKYVDMSVASKVKKYTDLITVPV